MKSGNGKYKFWQVPVMFWSVIIFEMALFLATVGTLLVAITSDPVFYIIAAICGAIFVMYLFAGFRFFFLRVEIDDERITIKGIYGVLTTCRIDEIKDVYIKFHGVEGTFIAIRDDRQVKKPYSYSERNGYIKFSYSKQREQLVKSFWKESISEFDWNADLK